MTQFKQESVSYMNGFGNEFESEADGYKGALPVGLVNPQKCKFGLVAEQLSGSAFTCPRGLNKRSWFYRIMPSVCHRPLVALDSSSVKFMSYAEGKADPNQRRWKPFVSQSIGVGAQLDFVEGLHTLAFSDADGSAQASVAIHIYLCNTDMVNKSFSNCDGDFLIVPQMGVLHVMTEFGRMIVEPNEIAVIQQGMKFSVSSPDSEIRGYVLEVRGNHFELPNLGPIGANCLANPRDFQTPTAYVDTKNLDDKHTTVVKFQNELFEMSQQHSPYDVAAWFGNYVPYKYDLSKFVAINSVTVDHPDPSIFTVLTCGSHGRPGTALADFVIFPPRWECASKTFRPPYFHRNCMTEFMGLIKGRYQAKSGQFAPGGASLHQQMMAHGPDEQCFLMASNQNTSQPAMVAQDTMAFMFETSLSLKLSKWAREYNVDADYHHCWHGLASIIKAMTVQQKE